MRLLTLSSVTTVAASGNAGLNKVIELLTAVQQRTVKTVAEEKEIMNKYLVDFAKTETTFLMTAEEQGERLDRHRTEARAVNFCLCFWFTFKIYILLLNLRSWLNSF